MACLAVLRGGGGSGWTASEDDLVYVSWLEWETVNAAVADRKINYAMWSHARRREIVQAFREVGACL